MTLILDITTRTRVIGKYKDLRQASLDLICTMYVPVRGERSNIDVTSGGQTASAAVSQPEQPDIGDNAPAAVRGRRRYQQGEPADVCAGPRAEVARVQMSRPNRRANVSLRGTGAGLHSVRRATTAGSSARRHAWLSPPGGAAQAPRTDHRYITSHVRNDRTLKSIISNISAVINVEIAEKKCSN